MALIICTGIAVMDQIFSVVELPSAAGKYFAESLLEVGGGPAASAAVTAARLDSSSAFWGRVGNDAMGTRILNDLMAEGVDVSAARQIDGGHSTLSTVLVDHHGERMIVSYSDSKLDPDPDHLPLDRLAAADVVLADVRWPQGAAAVLRRTRELGLPAVLDADQGPDQDIGELVALASHVVFSEPALRSFTGVSDLADGLHQAAAQTSAWLCVTAGVQGCYFLEDGELCHQPAFTVEVVDTLGAGDVFHGALAVALAEGQTRPAAVRFASATAALKCTRFGGRAGIPSRAEVMALLETR